MHAPPRSCPSYCSHECQTREKGKEGEKRWKEKVKRIGGHATAHAMLQMHEGYVHIPKGMLVFFIVRAVDGKKHHFHDEEFSPPPLLALHSTPKMNAKKVKKCNGCTYHSRIKAVAHPFSELTKPSLSNQAQSNPSLPQSSTLLVPGNSWPLDTFTYTCSTLQSTPSHSHATSFLMSQNLVTNIQQWPAPRSSLPSLSSSL